MLPALVPEEHPWVKALLASTNKIAGPQPRPWHYHRSTFDAGGGCSRGVPTVMFGAGGGVHNRLLDTDFVPISLVEGEAKVLAHLILSQLS